MERLKNHKNAYAIFFAAFLYETYIGMGLSRLRTFCNIDNVIIGNHWSKNMVLQKIIITENNSCLT